MIRLRECVPGLHAVDTETGRAVRVIGPADRKYHVIVERTDNLHQYYIHHRELRRTRADARRKKTQPYV